MSKAALTELERFSKVFKVFSEAENAMRELVSLEQNQRDLLNVVTSLKKEVTELEQTREKRQQEIASLASKYNDKVKREEDSLQESLSKMVLEAQKKVDEVVGSEEVEVQKLRDETKKLLSRNQQLQDSINAKTVKETELDENIKAATQSINNILGHTQG